MTLGELVLALHHRLVLPPDSRREGKAVLTTELGVGDAGRAGVLGRADGAQRRDRRHDDRHGPTVSCANEERHQEIAADLVPWPFRDPKRRVPQPVGPERGPG